MYRRVLLFNQSFHWIADMFKEIMDAVKSNILLLNVVPLLSISCLLLDYESIFYYSFIFAFFFPVVHSYIILFVFTIGMTICIFLMHRSFTSHEHFGASCFLTMAWSSIVVLLGLPCSQGCHCSNDAVHGQSSSPWSHILAFASRSRLRVRPFSFSLNNPRAFPLGLSCWHRLL